MCSSAASAANMFWKAFAIAAVCCWSVTAGTDSILDVSEVKCRTHPRTKDVCVATTGADVMNSRPSRTDMDCLIGCKDLANCGSVFRDTEGTCYELYDTDVPFLARDVGHLHGNHMKVVSKGDPNDCSGKVCASNEFCFTGCGDSSTATPTCVADHRFTCDLGQEYTNLRHYWSPATTDDRDSGAVMTVTYPKKRSLTGLRVIVHVNTNPHVDTAERCHHWYLTFDENKCLNPANIEQLDYNVNSGNYRRNSDIDGTCYGLSEGNRVIKLWINPCDGYASSDGSSGWKSARTMMIMEIIPTDLSPYVAKSCPLSSVFNYQYNAWEEEIEDSHTNGDDDILVKAFNYTKMADDTALRIKYSGLMTVKVPINVSTTCGRWYLAINGEECSPAADAIILHNSTNNYDYWREHTHTMSIEGVCTNSLVAGDHTIEVYVGQCPVPYDGTFEFKSGGFSSPSRMHIEEVRAEQKVDGLYTQSHAVYRSMTGYLSQIDLSGSSVEANTETATVYSFTYDKQFADTGLRLTATGNHMSRYTSGYSRCSRWFFKIDDAECTSPGTIEGLSHFNYDTEYYHSMQVSGMCSGVGVGNRTITYNVGRCSGFAENPFTVTNFGSSFFIIVEELRADLEKTCDSNPVQCYGP